jgi:hypothetical protein
LTDGSDDVWKTLHNWILMSPPDATLTLLTNATAPDDSAMSLLRGGADRDPSQAAEKLATVARASGNVAQRDYHKAFLNLSEVERESLLERVVLADAVPAVADLAAQLEMSIRKATTPPHRTALVERLRGWWFQRLFDHLELIASGDRDRILSYEIESQLLTIAQRLRDDDLPIDFYDLPLPTPEDVAADDRPFVHQLRLIALSSSRLRNAIYDHNRAFAQRSRWEREKLLHVGELKQYEARLLEEWRRHCLPDTDEPVEDEKAARDDGRVRFLRLERSELPRIRTHVDAPWVGCGSLHMLADRLEIGWHPDWLNRMKQVLPDLVSDEESVA